MRVPILFALLTSISLGALSLPIPADAASTLQSPSGPWTITKSEKKNDARASYCTISRKFSGDVVFNYARNGDGALSVAFDFSNKELDKNASYTVNLDPGGNKAREFQARPITPRVILVSLGTDEKFEQALMGTEELSVTIAGEPVKLAVDEFSTQASKLKECVASLARKPAEEKIAAANKTPAPTPPSDDEPELTQNQPAKVMRMTDDAPLKPSPDTLLKDQSAPAINANPAVSFEATERLSILEKENNELKSALAKASQTVPQTPPVIKENNDALKNALAEKEDLEQKLAAQSQELSAIKEAQAKTVQSEDLTASLKDKLAALESENTSLKEAQAKLTPVEPLKAQIEALQSEKGALANAAAERDQLKIELAKLKEDAAKASAAPVPTSAEPVVKPDPAQAEKIRLLEQEVTNLTSENKMLAEKAKISLPDNAMKDAEIKGLKDDLQRLKEANGRLEDDLAATLVSSKSGSPMPPPLPIGDDVNEQAIAALNEQVAALETENTALKDQISKIPQNEKLKDLVSMEQPLREEIRSLRAQLDESRAHIQAVSSNIDQARAKINADQMSVSSKNWDLEQATRRYQESEREVQRLSLQLEQQKVQCTNSKRELEYMMFDPQTAPAAQTALLNSLEDKLAAQEKQLASLGARSSGNTATLRMLAKPTAPPSEPALVSLGPASGADQGADSMNADNSVLSVPLPALQPQRVAPVPPASERLPSTASLTPQNVPTGRAHFLSPQEFQTVLVDAQVAVSGPVQKLTKSTAPNALRWDTGQTFGSLEQREAKDPNAFRTLVQGYLDRTKTRCKGDFAASPASVSASGVSAYDIACVSGKQSSSAAVAFFLKDGIFNVIAHEAAPAQVNMAMEARDKIVKQIVR